MAAVTALIDGQRTADHDAGLDWSTLTVPASRLDEPLRRAHARLPIDLNDPTVYINRDDQRRVLAGRLGLAADKADDLSRWALAYPDDFDPEDLRCWRIGSSTWLALADEQLETIERVQRPVGLFVAPAIRTEGWQLSPVLSLEAIRLVEMLGGQVDRDLCAAALPFDRVPALLERINLQTLHAGPKECLDSAGQLASELSAKLGQRVSPGVPRDKRDRWGRLVVSRTGYTGNDGTRRSELRLRVVTFPTRDFTQRRLGARRMSEKYNAQASAAMDLGEAVQTAVERGLPLLLSTEAAGHLKDKIRVGRMKGRPGALTITTSDGLSATTRRLVAEQAIAELRALKRAGAKVTLDAGARQMVRMTVARPLDDDPVLLGRQKEIAALKVVGSGVDASQTGAGKTITSGRALANRASTTRRFRAMVVAEGRLLGQWRDELTKGAPGRGLPPLAPNVELLVLDDQRQVAGQLRAFDRELGDRPGRGAVRQQHARPLPGRPAGNPLAPADRRRGAPLRQPGDRGPSGARPGSLRRGRRLLASDRHPARQERRAPRRARRPGGRRQGDDHRAAQHPRGGRPDGRAERPPAAGQLRAAPGAGDPPGHAAVDADRAASQAARGRPRPGA